MIVAASHASEHTARAEARADFRRQVLLGSLVALMIIAISAGIA